MFTVKTLKGNMTSSTGKYHHGNLHRELINATLQLISEKGVKAFTIREVAKRAGVSHAAPYRHFRDKEDLLAAVAKDGFDMMVSDTRERFRKYPDDPLARFQISGLAYIDFAVTYPSHYRVMFASGENRHKATVELNQSSKEAFMFLYNSICECQDAGLVRPGDPSELAMAAWSIVHGYAMLYIDGFIGSANSFFPNSNNELKYLITEALYQGLRPDTNNNQ